MIWGKLIWFFVEIPAKLLTRFLGRIESTKLPGIKEKMALSYLDWFSDSVDPDRDFNDSYSSTKFLAQIILPRSRGEIETVIESFSIWLGETKKDKETKIYCAAFLVDRMCKKYGESLKGNFQTQKSKILTFFL